MLIQPFVENAVKHGLLLSPKGGKVTIDISYLNEDLVVVISDNGIGRKKAAEIKGDRSGHVSLGTLIIDQRIELLNQLGYRLDVKTEDVHPHGTRVSITLKE
jgi:sensor histidine kinase YesM